MVVFEVGSEQGTIPSGRYLFTLKSVEPDTTPSQFGNKARNKWVFEIADILELDEEDADDAGLVGREVWQWATHSMRPNSTQYAWISGMMFNGKPVPKDARVDSQELVGQSFKVEWGSKPYSIQATGEAGTKDTIIKIRPNKTEPSRRAPRATVEREDDEDF